MQPPTLPRDPKMIGLWKVGRTLGKGFSGHVRIARHSRTGQYAAIKIISKGSLGSRISLNRLADEVEHSLLAVEREIVVMKLINHPNVMKLYDVWETSSSLYLILEYVQGGELFDYLCNEGRRPVNEALDYFQQIICAVNHCHRFNIAHRDLKLENILIDQNSDIKVADFGMAAWQDSSIGSLLKTSCGSPHYAAPEVISGKPYNGAGADIWSCGIILYALLAAKLPFDDDDCPALLQKIGIGKFDMPTDIAPQAQDLISRMLTTDVTKRITMPEIMRHPFFLSRPLKNPQAMASNLNIDLNAQPIGSRSTIDPDVFANLRTLWPGTQDAELVEALTSQERNWQKGVYHLLLSFRKKHLESRQEEEHYMRSSQGRKKRRQMENMGTSESSLPPRSGPPTPRRARGQDYLRPFSTMSFIHVEKPVLSAPLMTPGASSADRRTPFNSPAVGIDTMDLSMVAAPELEDEKIQAFFQQVANHLNILQARVNSGGSPRPASHIDWTPPMLKLPTMPSTTLLPSRFTSRKSNIEDTPSPFVLPPMDQSSTRPLSVRPKSRPPAPIIITHHASDKENVLRITESDIINRQSPLLQHAIKMKDNRDTLALETPMMRKSAKLKKPKPLCNSPISPNFSDAGSSFSESSSPGSCTAPKRWLDTVFKFKPASYSLLSRGDVHTTRSECRRLLMEMDLLVSLEESEKLGTLKCRSIEVQEGSMMSQGVKAVKFRVEMQWPTPQLCQDGYLVSLYLVQEKGSLEAFKGIYQQLARNWTLGHSRNIGGMSSSALSSTKAVGG